jgi:hypothetical protein
MKNRLFLAFVGAISALVLSVPLAAHHGVTGFDRDKTISLKGSVVSWAWANPHCFLKIDFKDDHGNVIYWLGETTGPQDLENLGWSRDSLKPGDEVTVTMTPAKNGSHVGLIQQVLLPNGQTLRAGRGKGLVQIRP